MVVAERVKLSPLKSEAVKRSSMVVLQFWRINLISRADASRTLGFRSVQVAAI